MKLDVIFKIQSIIDNRAVPSDIHQILDEDIGIVTEVLKSEYLTQGPYVQQVEESMAKLQQVMSVLHKSTKKKNEILTKNLDY